MARETLLTGGSGLLGRELQKHIQVDAPSHKEFDITCPQRRGEYGLIIHAAAYTNVAKAETEREECFEVNVQGTHKLLLAYPDTPFVYISSEYAHKPVNFYSITKLGAEEVVKTKSDKYLIIRTLFKPTPFPFNRAFADQYTQGDYVDVIAPLMVDAIYKWDRQTCKTIYVGTGRKTMLELAERTRPFVIPNSIKDIKNVTIPADYE